MASQAEIFVKALSRLLGWIYTLCWSASFYPQPMRNYRRRSTFGSTVDFPTLNILGFSGYVIYTSTFLWSPVIRKQYAARHPAAEDSTVRFNDFVFALHAVILSVIVYSQFWPKAWGFKSSGLRMSRPIAVLFWGCLLAIAITTCVVLAASPDEGFDPSSWAWIDVIYTLSYVKLIVTIFKYIPQAWLNYKLQSTAGWDIIQILFDLIGGVLSLIQLIIDSAFQDDWSGITGNPVKLLLSNITIFFDLIFVVQHYILYKDAQEDVDDINKRQGPSLITPLLSEPDDLSRAARV